MQLRPDSVPHILPHDRKSVPDHVLFDRPANIEQPVALANLSIASSSDSSVTFSSFFACSLNSPTPTVSAESPKYPFSETPVSIETISPFFKILFGFGIP